MTRKTGGSRTVTLLAAAVLVLLPVLAALQYRWLGQVSEHERDRLRRTLTNATGAVARDLDSTLDHAIGRLPIERLATRQRGTSPDGDGRGPDGRWLIDGLFYVERSDDELVLESCSPSSDICTPVPWPEELTDLRSDLRAAFRRSSDRDVEELSRAPRAGAGKRPIVVVPVEHHDEREHGRGRSRRLAGAALVALDTKMLRTQVLPAIVERHFGAPDSSDFRIAIVDWELPLDVVYDASGGQLEKLLADPEAWQELFTLRADEFGDRRPMTEGGHTSGAGFSKTFGRTRGDDCEEWLLVARHRDGSLQAAVDNLRRRNLIAISGILLLMGVAVGLIALTSRRAQRLAEQQVEFVAGVSHELRTPVAAIHLAVQNLADGMVTDPARMQRYGATIKVETERLRNTVERVMQFASLSGRRGSGPQTPVALPAIVQDVVDAARRDHPTAAFAVDVPADLPTVMADAAGLRVCVDNLIVNAVKYGGAAPRVRISAAPHRVRRGMAIRLSVEDDGPGIDAVDTPHVFEPFYRGRNALQRRIQGNGLGLHLVKRIVEDHGGRVHVHSTPNEGTTFIVILPVRPFEAAAATDDAAVRPLADSSGAPSGTA